MIKSKRQQRVNRNRNINTRKAYNHNNHKRGGSKDKPASPKKSPSPQTDYDDAELFPDDGSKDLAVAVAKPRQKYTLNITTPVQKQVDMFRDLMLKRSGPTGTGILPWSRKDVLSKSSLARRVMHNFITGSRQPVYLKTLINVTKKPQQKLLVNMFQTNYMPIITGFRAPNSIALDRDGNLAVVDNENNRICVYNPITGNILRTLTLFKHRCGINSIVFVFDEESGGLTDELIVTTIGLLGERGVMLVNYVTGQIIRDIYSTLTYEPRQLIDVVYDGAIQVRVEGEMLYYTKKGSRVKENTVKIPGSGPMAYYTKNKFKDYQPILVADSAKGNLYETSYGEVFPVLNFGTGTGWGQFKGIGGIAVDCIGNTIVTDKGNHRIHIFNPDFSKARIIGKLGDAYGDFNNPTGVAVDCHGNIFVCDTGNNRIQVIRYRV
jgi:DNA-binding beta-propeller fold protein YncE